MYKLAISSNHIVNGQEGLFESDLIVENEHQLKSCVECHKGCHIVIYDMCDNKLMTIGRK